MVVARGTADARPAPIDQEIGRQHGVEGEVYGVVQRHAAACTVLVALFPAQASSEARDDPVVLGDVAWVSVDVKGRERLVGGADEPRQEIGLTEGEMDPAGHLAEKPG